MLFYVPFISTIPCFTYVVSILRLRKAISEQINAYIKAIIEVDSAQIADLVQVISGIMENVADFLI